MIGDRAMDFEEEKTEWNEVRVLKTNNDDSDLKWPKLTFVLKLFNFGLIQMLLRSLIGKKTQWRRCNKKQKGGGRNCEVRRYCLTSFEPQFFRLANFTVEYFCKNILQLVRLCFSKEWVSKNTHYKLCVKITDVTDSLSHAAFYTVPRNI